ncbi:MAG: hypothetical protein ACLSHG_03865 [Oscillospiraceae bacterium]
MKRWKVYLCAAVFPLLTAVKMIAPAAAADAREVLLPAINADDDYKSVFAEIRSVFAPAPVQTQDEQLRQYLPAVNMSALVDARTGADADTHAGTDPGADTDADARTDAEPAAAGGPCRAQAFQRAGGLFRLCSADQCRPRGQRAAVCAHVTGRGLYFVRLRLPAASIGKQGEISLRHRFRGQFRHRRSVPLLTGTVLAAGAGRRVRQSM